MEAAPQHSINDDSKNAGAVTRTNSNEEAPFTVNDLQSELSSIPNLAETHQSSISPASQLVTNASGLDAKALSPFTHDSPQVWSSGSAAAAAHIDDIVRLTNPAEGAEGHNRAQTEQAEQQTLQSTSADANAATTTGYVHASLQAENTSPEALATPQQPPEALATPQQPPEALATPQQPPEAQKQHTRAEEHPPSSTEAGPGRAEKEEAAAPGSSSADQPMSTSSTHPVDHHAAPQPWLRNAPISEPSAADAPTAGSALQPAISRDDKPSSEQLHMHASEAQGHSSWATDAFPDATTDVKAAAATASTEADTDADLEGSSIQAQGQLEGGDKSDVAEEHQASTKDTPYDSSTALGSHTNTDQLKPHLETPANDSSWGHAAFAKPPAPMNTDMPSDGEVPASEGLELPTESSISQHSLAMPEEPLTDESDWADNAFAAATAAPDAEQTAAVAPSAETQAAVAGIVDATDNVAQAVAASSEAPSVELSAPDTKVPHSPSATEASPAATTEADTSVTGEANTAADTNAPEQPGKQQADEDDWGDDDDDFGDFNDAGDDADDGGFGAFNEAEAVTPRSADASVRSPESQQAQALSMPPVPHELPQPSLLSRLLNATQQDLPIMLRQIADPLTAPFATLPPLSELPINPDGSHSHWRFNGQALLEHHMKQAKKLPVSDVLPTAGLLGQPQPGSNCPAAPSFTRSKVAATSWQGSRGDIRLLARLGLSQAGLQDERDAQEKALAAKNRWRRKSSSKGLMPVRLSDTPQSQGGPLSYLSTVTTASTSEWGSQSLDSFSKQPSEAASASKPIASTSAADARPASSIATSSGQGGGGNGNGDSRQQLGRKLSSPDQSSTHQGRANSRSSRASAEASETVSSGNTSRAQGGALYSKTPSTATEAEVSRKASGSAAVHSDGLKQTPLAGPSGSESQRQAPDADDATTSNSAAADWSAFGRAARNEADNHQPQHATASAHQSGHALPVPGTSHVSAAQDEWSAFDEPGTASFAAAPSSLDDSAKGAAPAGPGFHNTNPFLDPEQVPRKQVHLFKAGAGSENTNPFLEPGENPWQHDNQAAAADSAEVVRMASGDSFGDFNGPGEREDDIEVAAWDAAAVPEDKTDRTASADPFAASASFTDFAALLEPTQTDLLGGLDTIASVTQAPSAAQVGLSELQGDVDLGLQEGVRTSDQLPGLAKQMSGYGSPYQDHAESGAMQQQEILVAGISIPDLTFMLTADQRPHRT